MPRESGTQDLLLYQNWPLTIFFCKTCVQVLALIPWRLSTKITYPKLGTNPLYSNCIQYYSILLHYSLKWRYLIVVTCSNCFSSPYLFILVQLSSSDGPCSPLISMQSIHFVCICVGPCSGHVQITVRWWTVIPWKLASPSWSCSCFSKE